VAVPFFRWDLHRERNQQHAATHSLVYIVEDRFVVADDPQLEFGNEVEEVASHESGGHLIAARHRLDLSLVPPPRLLCLLGDGQPITVKLGNVCWVPLRTSCDERPDISDGSVVAENVGNHIDEC